MPDVGAVRYKVTAENKDIDKVIDQTEKKFKDSADDIERESKSTNQQVEKHFEQSGKSAQSSWKSAGASIAKSIGAAFVGVTAAAGAGIVSLAKFGVDFNSQMEQYQTSFEVMTGDAEKAVEITERLKDTAAKTPFGLQDLAETTQLLMNYGLTADAAMGSMEMLGDISQGSAEKMNRIAMAYGQMSSLGKVQLEDIKQMIEAGFNPLQEISEATGESMESLYARISDGTLAVDEITASMQRSTSEGGKYFQSMEKQSQTLSGQFSTFQDNFSAFAGEVVEGITPALSSAMDMMNKMFADQTLLNMLSSLFVVLGDIVTEAMPLLVDMLGQILPVFGEIVNEVLPVAVELFSQLLPPLIELVEAVLPVLSAIIEALLPIISAIAQAISPLIDILVQLIDLALIPLQIYLGYVSGAFTSTFNAITAVVTTAVGVLLGVLGGLIDFISGVFSGDWEKAWNGIVNIFGSIWEGIKNLAKVPVNAVIDILNGLIRGLNNIRIPDWVPVIGGAGINIPLIPRLKKGMGFVPKDFFPAYLDYGERVLTREENAMFNAVGGLQGMRDILEGARVPPQYPGGTQNAMQIEVPLYLDGREIARASAWYTGEQLAWEER